MLAALVYHTNFISRKLLLVTALSFIGFSVGLACALLPPVAPFGIVAAISLFLLWVLPEIRSVPDRWIKFLVAPLVFTFICVPVYYAIILPGLPWISIRRAVLFAWIIPLAISLAGSPTARNHIRSVFSKAKLLRFCLMSFFVLTLITTLTGIAPLTSANYLVLSILNWFIPLIGVVLCIRNERQIATLFKACIAAVGVNLLAGAWESHLQRPFLIYFLPAYMRDQILQANPIVQNNLINGMGFRAGVYRASSTYTTALSWGEISAMMVPMCLHFVAHGKSLAQRSLGIIGFGMCVASIALSGSRGAYVGMILATIAYSIAWAFRYNAAYPSRLAGKIWLMLYALASGATVLAVFLIGPIRRAVLGGGEAQWSTDSRYAEWAQAQPKILARPITGYGGGTAADVIHYMSSFGALSVDGFYMNLLVDYGIFGLLLFSAIFIVATVMCFHIYYTARGDDSVTAAAIGASILAFIIYRLTLSQTDSLTMAFMLVGVAGVLQSLKQLRRTATAH